MDHCNLDDKQDWLGLTKEMEIGGRRPQQVTSIRLDGPLLHSALESLSRMLHGPFDSQFPSQHVTPKCGRILLLLSSKRLLMIPESLRISIESTRPD